MNWLWFIFGVLALIAFVFVALAVVSMKMEEEKHKAEYLEEIKATRLKIKELSGRVSNLEEKL